MAQLLKLNGTTIKKPQSFDLESYNLTKAGRTLDGTMHLDLIAKKKKFLLKYDVLHANDLATILGIIDGNDMFFTLSYVDNDTTYTKTVYVGAIKKKQFRTDSGAWYWKDVTFDLIEQ